MTIALPVPVIVSNFDYFYQRERARKFHENIEEKRVEGKYAAGSDETRHDTYNTDLTATEKFRRQELIEGQKKIKRIRSHQNRLSERIFRANRAKKNIQSNGEKFERHLFIERETVV